MKLSPTYFDLDLDSYDTEIPWLKSVPCVPSPNNISKNVQSDVIQNTKKDSYCLRERNPSFRWNWMTGEVEQSNFDESSHPLDELLDLCNKSPIGKKGKENQHACEICQSTFARSCDLANHKRTHEPKSKLKFNKYNNVLPMQEIHPTAHEIQQGYCIRTLCQSAKQRYVCTICGKHFSFLKNLRSHQKIHTSIGLSNFCHAK